MLISFKQIEKIISWERKRDIKTVVGNGSGTLVVLGVCPQ